MFVKDVEKIFVFPQIYQSAAPLERWFTLILFFYQCIVPAWLGRAQPDLQLVNVFNTEAHPFEKAAFDPVLIKERLSLE